MSLTDEERTFLDELHFAVVATLNPDGTPQLTTLWYMREGHDLIFNTEVGRLKERNLRRDPRMAVTILSEDGYRYITVKGAAALDELSGQEVIHALAARYHGREAAEIQMRDSFSTQQRVTIRMPMASVFSVGFGT